MEYSIHLSELSPFMVATVFAALASAGVRAATAPGDQPLRTFRHFYVDLAAAFASLALLRESIQIGSPQLRLSVSTGVMPTMDLILPVAVGLLLLAVLAARHRWSSPRGAKRADATATVAVVLAIAASASLLAGNASLPKRLDAASQSMLSSFCRGTESASALSTANQNTHSPAMHLARFSSTAASSDALSEGAEGSAGAVSAQATQPRGGGRWRARRDRPNLGSVSAGHSELCAALDLYVRVRQGLK